MKLALGSDHAGFEAKQIVEEHLREKGYEVVDKGAFSSESVDYPDIAFAVAKSVASEETDAGILLCGTGIGMSIAANKVDGIRAALCHDKETAALSRQHNDANVLAVGARINSIENILDIVDTWLEEKFLGDRHKRRVEKIMAREKENS